MDGYLTAESIASAPRPSFVEQKVLKGEPGFELVVDVISSNLNGSLVQLYVSFAA